MAFLAKLVTSYLFVKYKNHFLQTMYHVVYQDDGLVVFRGRKKVQEIRKWLKYFQQIVNKAAGNQHLLFTAEI